MALGNTAAQTAKSPGVPVFKSVTRPDAYGDPVVPPSQPKPLPTFPRTYEFAVIKANNAVTDYVIPSAAGNAVFAQNITDGSPGPVSFVFDDERSGLVRHQFYRSFGDWIKITGPQFGNLKLRLETAGTYIIRLTVWENPQFAGFCDISAP
jgi:hypothetical protein